MIYIKYPTIWFTNPSLQAHLVVSPSLFPSFPFHHPQLFPISCRSIGPLTSLGPRVSRTTGFWGRRHRETGSGLSRHSRERRCDNYSGIHIWSLPHCNFLNVSDQEQSVFNSFQHFKASSVYI